MSESQAEPTAEQLIEELRKVKVSDLLVHTSSMLASLAFGKLAPETRDLDQAPGSRSTPCGRSARSSPRSARRTSSRSSRISSSPTRAARRPRIALPSRPAGVSRF